MWHKKKSSNPATKYIEERVIELYITDRMYTFLAIGKHGSY